MHAINERLSLFLDMSVIRQTLNKSRKLNLYFVMILSLTIFVCH